MARRHPAGGNTLRAGGRDRKLVTKTAARCRVVREFLWWAAVRQLACVRGAARAPAGKADDSWTADKLREALLRLGRSKPLARACFDVHCSSASVGHPGEWARPADCAFIVLVTVYPTGSTMRWEPRAVVGLLPPAGDPDPGSSNGRSRAGGSVNTTTSSVTPAMSSRSRSAGPRAHWPGPAGRRRPPRIRAGRGVARPAGRAPSARRGRTQRPGSGPSCPAPAVLPLDPDRVLPLPGESGVVDHEYAVRGGERGGRVGAKPAQDGAVVPWALAVELLEGRHGVLAGQIGRGDAVGEGRDALAAAVGEQAAGIPRPPGPAWPGGTRR